jgi:hypothetical protein
MTTVACLGGLPVVFAAGVLFWNVMLMEKVLRECKL